MIIVVVYAEKQLQWGTGSCRHPDQYWGAANSYFRSIAVSSSIPMVVLVGGVDHVTVLSMTAVHVVQWLMLGATSFAFANCSADSAGYIVDYLCRNHLAIFPNPADPSRLVVCRSGAFQVPSCWAVNVICLLDSMCYRKHCGTENIVTVVIKLLIVYVFLVLV